MIYLRHKGFRQEACFIKAPASAERVFFLFSYLEFALFPTEINNSFNIHFFGSSFKSLGSDQRSRRKTSTDISRFYSPT